jgi:hypothetical protein
LAYSDDEGTLVEQQQYGSDEASTAAPYIVSSDFGGEIQAYEALPANIQVL